ncbi:MAG: molybdate ABC transporter permease subunit [Acidobacteria bacterium]|nr:molybdate ABC transporter permease subunit [Acidobacteriota bacterium]
MLTAISNIDWFPIQLSFQVSSLATAIALVFGVILAWVLARFRFWGREWLDAAITLPLVLPPTVLGYYLLVVLGQRSFLGRVHEWFWGSPLTFTPAAAVVAATIHALPLMVKSVRAAFEALDQRIEDAARTLGASELRVFMTVTLPLACRSVQAATALAFARALGDFGVTLMIAGNIPGKTQTASVAIYDAVQAGREQDALVLVLIVSALALTFLYTTNKLSSTKF